MDPRFALCTYWDKDTSAYTERGMVVVGLSLSTGEIIVDDDETAQQQQQQQQQPFQDGGVGGQMQRYSVLCATTHFSEFTLMSVPLGVAAKAKLLFHSLFLTQFHNYPNIVSIVPLLLLFLTNTLMVLLGLRLRHADARNKHAVHEAARLEFMRSGWIKTSDWTSVYTVCRYRGDINLTMLWRGAKFLHPYLAPWCQPLCARRVFSRWEHTALLLSLLMWRFFNCGLMLKFENQADDELYEPDYVLAVYVGIRAAASSWLVATLLPEWYKRVKQYYSMVNKHLQIYLVGADSEFLDLTKIPIRARIRLKLSKARQKLDFRRNEYAALHASPVINHLRHKVLVQVRVALLIFYCMCLHGSVICE